MVVVYPIDDEGDGQVETESAEPQEYDNSVEQAVFPEGIAETMLDDETAEDVDTRDRILQEEVKDRNFRIYETMHEVNVRAVMDNGRDELPEDYSEDDDAIDDQHPVDEDGKPIIYDEYIYDEYIEREQEKEREKEAGEEKLTSVPRMSTITQPMARKPVCPCLSTSSIQKNDTGYANERLQKMSALSGTEGCNTKQMTGSVKGQMPNGRSGTRMLCTIIFLSDAELFGRRKFTC